MLPFVRRVTLLPHALPFGVLQAPLKDGARLAVDDQLRAKLLQGALGERTRLQFNAQRHLPPQVVVSALFRFVIRDQVIVLQHQRRR